ncbi:MAG: phosphatase PAP2 family protein [Actinomycetota bacterium]|nr:phosphatase PAP2 family protein [Actinomycetota bacterium]
MSPAGGLDRRPHRRARRRPTAGNGALLLLGRSAGNARLWLAVAVGLALSGGRFPRRAALRGLFALGLASGASGPVKLAFRRRPPVTGRRSRRLPRLPEPEAWSLPSQHTASAFAFAVGAGQEVPVLAGPLLALATLVGYSRVHAGADCPSDAAVGAGLGAVAGLLTRRLWPVAPHEPADVRTALTRAQVTPSPKGRGLVIVVNLGAGSSGRVAEELRRELPDAEVVEVEDGGAFETAIADAAERGCAVGVAGGDGSVNTAAALAADHGKPLFVVPGGTLNHFAYALGLETIADAARAVREGRAVSVDRALIDGHTFVNTAGIGSYVDLVDARERLEDTIGKWPAVVVALARVLRTATPVELEIDGEPRRLWMMFIGNCRYHPAGFAPSWRERLDDGQLDVRIVDGSHPWSRVRLLASVVTGRLGRCTSYEQRFVRTLTIRSLDGRLRLARDGETFDGREEFTVAKADDPLLVYVPEP